MIVITDQASRLASTTPILDALPRRLEGFEDSGDRSSRLAAELHLDLEYRGPRDVRYGSTLSVSKLGIDGLFRAVQNGKVSAEVWSRFLSPGKVEGFERPYVNCIAACATGVHSWIRAARMLEEDMADAVIAGAAEATLNELVVAGFRRMKVLSKTAPRPFDRRRDGFVPAEGGAAVLLERELDVRADGRRILGRLLGWSISAGDGDVLTGAMTPDGIIRLIENALSNAKIAFADLNYIHLHGTGTEQNDPAEAMALRRLADDRDIFVPASSTKALTGHCLGAAGAVEALLTLDALRRGSAPPTYGLESIAPACETACLIREETALTGKIGLVLSYGFGGSAGALVIEGVSNEVD